MSRIVFNIIIIIGLFLNQNLFADSSDIKVLKDPSVFIKNSKQIVENLLTIENDFVQKKHLSVFAEDVKSKGKFYFKKENLLRWEYTSPINYILVMNQDKIYIKDGEKISTFDIKSNSMISEINEIMLACISGNILNNDGRFKVSFFENRYNYLVELVPQSAKMKEYLRKIELIFNKSNFAMIELRIIENAGDYTYISFYNRKFNEVISDEKFNIK